MSYKVWIDPAALAEAQVTPSNVRADSSCD
jgi:hypothetical protein